MVNPRVTKTAACVCWEEQGGSEGRDSSPTGDEQHDRTCVWPYGFLQAPPGISCPADSRWGASGSGVLHATQ